MRAQYVFIYVNFKFFCFSFFNVCLFSIQNVDMKFLALPNSGSIPTELALANIVLSCKFVNCYGCAHPLI